MCRRRWDTIYKLVSTLDACVRARTVSEKHLAELQQACQPLTAAPATRRSTTAAPAAAVRHSAATSAAHRRPAAPHGTASRAGSSAAAGKRPRQQILDSDEDDDEDDDEFEGEVLARADPGKAAARQVLDDDEDAPEEAEGETGGGGAGAKDDESIQRSAAESADVRKLLHDTSAALADPAVRHVLAFDVIRRLYTRVSAAAVLPRSDATTVVLLQLLELGAQAGGIAAGHPDAPRCLPPPPPEALHTLLPILAGVMADIKLAKVWPQASEHLSPLVACLCRMRPMRCAVVSEAGQPRLLARLAASDEVVAACVCGGAGQAAVSRKLRWSTAAAAAACCMLECPCVGTRAHATAHAGKIGHAFY